MTNQDTNDLRCWRLTSTLASLLNESFVHTENNIRKTACKNRHLDRHKRYSQFLPSF